MSVTFKFDVGGILENVDRANREAIAIMSEQVLADSNSFCKLDQGTLIDSSLNNSDLENGVIVWDTPYAQRQYYLESAHTDKNPNAQMMWAHKARDIYVDQWLTTYKKAFKNARR